MLERRQDLAANETRTRNALVDPMLNALDWDVSNPSQVTTEHDLPSGRVDYALLGRDGKVAAIIEAKKLGEGLEKHRGQLVRYAYEAKPAYAVLTNGDLWEVYGVEADERNFRLQRLFEHSLSENDPSQSARKMLVLWQPNLESDEPVATEEPVVEAPTANVSAPQVDQQAPNVVANSEDAEQPNTGVSTVSDQSPGPDEAAKPNRLHWKEALDLSGAVHVDEANAPMDDAAQEVREIQDTTRERQGGPKSQG